MSVLSWRGKPLSRLALITIVSPAASMVDTEKDNSLKWLFSSPVFKSHARTCVKFDLYASDNIWAGRNGAPYGSKLAGRPPHPHTGLYGLSTVTAGGREGVLPMSR
jgi:hypothetical protein